MARCKSCDAEIIWLETPRGRRMPCDAGRQFFPDGAVVTIDGAVTKDGGDGWRPHWASCSGADKHRKSPQRSLFEI